MKHLTLSPELRLPLDVAGEAIGLLATRGAGKSYTSAVLIEELHEAGVQLAVLDPAGVYWGLRTSADGKGEGLPISCSAARTATCLWGQPPARSCSNGMPWPERIVELAIQTANATLAAMEGK